MTKKAKSKAPKNKDYSKAWSRVSTTWSIRCKSGMTSGIQRLATKQRGIRFGACEHMWTTLNACFSPCSEYHTWAVVSTLKSPFTLPTCYFLHAIKYRGCQCASDHHEGTGTFSRSALETLSWLLHLHEAPPAVQAILRLSQSTKTQPLFIHKKV